MNEKTTLGLCPVCFGKVTLTERRIDGDSICERGHKFQTKLMKRVTDRKILTNDELIRDMLTPPSKDYRDISLLLLNGANRILKLEKELANALESKRNEGGQ